MAIGRPVRDTETDPFYDMLFNMLIAILAFHPNARKAEFMVTVSWPDNNPNDVDAWVMEPGGKTLWFRQVAQPVAAVAVLRQHAGSRANQQGRQGPGRHRSQRGVGHGRYRWHG